MNDQERKTTPLDKTFPKIFSNGGIFPVSLLAGCRTRSAAIRTLSPINTGTVLLH